jgi:hypothetical protein
VTKSAYHKHGLPRPCLLSIALVAQPAVTTTEYVREVGLVTFSASVRKVFRSLPHLDCDPAGYMEALSHAGMQITPVDLLLKGLQHEQCR